MTAIEPREPSVADAVSAPVATASPVTLGWETGDTAEAADGAARPSAADAVFAPGALGSPVTLGWETVGTGRAE